MWNQERRPVVLAAVLFFALGCSSGTAISQDTHKVLPGGNEISSVTLVILSGEHRAYRTNMVVEYFYNGNAGPIAIMQADIPKDADDPGLSHFYPGRVQVKPGKNKVTTLVSRSGRTGLPVKDRTESIKISLISVSGEVLVSRSYDQIIDWPSSDRFSLASKAPEEIERLYTLCVETIDSGHGLDNAKRGLEQILFAKPDYVSAYVEMARYQLQTNWGTDGLLQAEQLLQTALRLDANHINTLVLTGFVYAHQSRFKEAENVLRKVEAIDPKYIWLYVNWGHLRALEGRKNEAIENYRKAILAQVTSKTNEQARIHAYERLLAMLTKEQRWHEVDALHRQRIDKYPGNGCYKEDYAEFRLARNGDYENAIAIGDKVLEQYCRDERINGRLILAMAYFTKWAELSGSSANTRETDQYFNRGQALYSDMPTLLYSLARSSHTAIVIPGLKRRGIGIDTPDREGISALGHSVLKQDIEAGQALIHQGANVNQRLYPDGLTPLMLAASRGDYAFVSMLLKNGADRRLRTRSGYTAERFAAESGFKEIAAQLVAPSGV